MKKQYYVLALLVVCLFYSACSGSVSEHGTASNDKIPGPVKDSLVFNEEGILTEKLHYCKGRLIGPQYHYYSNGDIKRIRYHVAGNAVFFEMNYNEDRGVSHTSGVPVFVIVKDKNAYHHNDTSMYFFDAGDTMVVIHEVVLIDRIKSVLSTSLINQEGKPVNDSTVYDFGYYEPDNMSYFTDRIVLREKGEYRYISRVNLLDSVSKRSVICDSVVQYIHVE